MSRSFQIPQRWKKEQEARKKSLPQNQPKKSEGVDSQKKVEEKVKESRSKPQERREELAQQEPESLDNGTTKKAKRFVRRAGGEVCFVKYPCVWLTNS